MPPRTVITAARKAGFGRFKVYPHTEDLAKVVYISDTWKFLKPWALRWEWVRKLRTVAGLARLVLQRADHGGIVVMIKERAPAA
jgi:hypothetical protein